MEGASTGDGSEGFMITRAWMRINSSRNAGASNMEAMAHHRWELSWVTVADCIRKESVYSKVS